MENNQAMVPKFSVKSAGFLFSMGLLCGVLLPSVLLWTFNLPFNIGAMIFLPVGIAFALAYSHYFIETKKGFCKRFIWLVFISLILFDVIFFLWVV
ncbi:hypothetical protein HRD97_12055 [Enterococcus faecalis]|nr:hypothetical protein [Enterococcus faecalis]